MHKTHLAGSPFGIWGECSLCHVAKSIYSIHEKPIDYEEIGRLVLPVIRKWLDQKIAAANAIREST